MTVQQQATMDSMIEWLANERELGHKPSKIELAGNLIFTTCIIIFSNIRRPCLANGWSVSVAVMKIRQTPSIADMYSVRCDSIILPRRNRKL